jgi:indole-3-glycerol phosphate synthase
LGPGLTEANVGYLDEKALKVRALRQTEAPRGTRLEALKKRALEADGIPSLHDALRGGDRVALVAEYKRRSPSAGSLAANEQAADVARIYERAGAAGVSVLTDRPDFLGEIGDLDAVSRAVGLPTLRKDFIVDGPALYEARAAGAAAALLIMRILAEVEVESLLATARDAGLECLVEVHDEGELETALGAGVTLIGINNRDLQSLTTNLEATERLAGRVPGGVTLVSESGIKTADDVRRVRDAGVHGVLVGEALLRSPPEERERRAAELAGVER